MVETLVGQKPLASSSSYSPYLKAALHTQITKSSETTKVLLKAGGKEEAITCPQMKSLNWYMKKVSDQASPSTPTMSHAKKTQLTAHPVEFTTPKTSDNHPIRVRARSTVIL